MDRKFWLDRWQANQIGFHGTEFNPWLVRHWGAVGLASGDGVFVPLCGKSLDMRWLETRGHRVIGVELALSAVDVYFGEAGEAAVVDSDGAFTRHRGRDTTIYCGDLFDLTAAQLDGVRGVYDRAALVALPPDMRARYADHLLRVIPDGSRILLVTVEYDQALMSGPPFSVERAEVERLFGARCRVDELARAAMTRRPAQLRDAAAQEAAYRLVKQR